MRVEDGLVLVDAVRGVNCYLVDTPDGLALVDAGIPGSAPKILEAMERLGREPRDLKHILLTHGDIDHVGGVAAVKAATGACVAIGALDAPGPRGDAPRKHRRGLLGLVMRVVFHFVKVEPFEPDRVLHEGDVVASLRVMHVPGHTPGSVAFVRDDRVVFSGDTLLGGRDGALHPPREGLSADFAQALVSAERIKALDPRLVLPGHGRPVRLR